MNEEIKKFWENAGYAVVHRPWMKPSARRSAIWQPTEVGVSEAYDVYDAYQYNSVKFTVAIVYKNKDIPTEYWYHNKQYTEQQMLRIIHLGAFL